MDGQTGQVFFCTKRGGVVGKIKYGVYFPFFKYKMGKEAKKGGGKNWIWLDKMHPWTSQFNIKIRNKSAYSQVEYNPSPAPFSI